MESCIEMKEWQVTRLEKYGTLATETLDLDEVIAKLQLRNIFSKVRFTLSLGSLM